MLAALFVEARKLNRSLAALLAIAAPSLIAVFVFFNMIRGKAPAPWDMWMGSASAIWAFFMLPMSVTALTALVAAGHAARVVLACDRGWQNDAGNVLGIYLHGLFEQASVMAALFGAKARDLDAVFDGLADHVERHCAAGVLAELIVERGAVTRW